MRIGLIGAMDAEIDFLISKMETEKTAEKAGMKFFAGFIDHTPVVSVKCGVGKVSAAMCVQILSDLFGVTHIINTGIAGSLDPRLNIGDYVIADDVLYFDVDATNFGYKPGEVPGIGSARFSADRKLADEMEYIIRGFLKDQNLIRGTISSGDVFVRTAAYKKRIVEMFSPLCCDMESAAIGHAAYLNRIPFAIMRAISDNADEESALSYEEFESKTAQQCAEIVYRFLHNRTISG